MDAKARVKTQSNAYVTLALIVGIVVLVNLLSLWLYGRLDLTQNQVYTLHDKSVAAVRDLDQVEVRVYISDNLPDQISLGRGAQLSLRGVDQKFLDKLEEFRGHSEGRLRILRVTGDVEAKAEKAKLRLFSAEDAKVADGQLTFTRYALGATFSYKNVTEVMPFAIQPEFYEYEITKILLRLREKYEHSRLRADILDAGEKLFSSVETCALKLRTATEAPAKADAALPIGGDALFSAQERLVQALPELKRVCEPVSGALSEAQGLFANRNPDLDRLLHSVRRFVDFYRQFADALASGDADQQRQAAEVTEVVLALFDAIDADHDALVDSPGRKTIGFVCGHHEFCPFAAAEPLFKPELAQILGQNNPFIGRFLQQGAQVEQEIDQISESIRRGLFTQQGFDVRQVDLQDPIPSEISALVLYGPQASYTERELFEVDQFLLSGRPVVVLLNQFDVSLRNLDEEGEMTVTKLTPIQTNLVEVLADYGVVAKPELILEPTANAPVILTELVRQGQFVWQSDRPFPFPLFPRFVTLNDSQALMRGLSSLALPYVSPLDGSGAASRGLEVTWLMRTSAEASLGGVTTELMPPLLTERLRQAKGTGPHDAALVVSGEFKSRFAGKDEPKPMDGRKTAPARERRDAGTSRMLVIGSNLGLENLSARRVFEGFDMAQVASGGFEFIEKARGYFARFQNWQVRIKQMSEVLSDSIPFLQNVMDWAAQNEELVSIRSKAFIKRPLLATTEGQVRTLRYVGVLAPPVLFLLLGAVRWQVRRRRKPVL